MTKYSAPSIPKKQQDPETLTGKIDDSAGPGKYKSKIELTKQQARQCSFGKSGVKREVFKASNTPGPCSY